MTVPSVADHRAVGDFRNREGATPPPRDILDRDAMNIERPDVRRIVVLLLGGGMLIVMPLVTGNAASLDVTGGVAQTFTVDVETIVQARHTGAEDFSTTMSTRPAGPSKPGPAVVDPPTSPPTTDIPTGKQPPSTPPPSTETGSPPAPSQTTTSDPSPLPTTGPTPSGDSPETSLSASGSTNEATTTDDAPDAGAARESAIE